MAISYAPRRGAPDTKSPGSFRNEAVRLVVQSARELMESETGDEWTANHDRLAAAVQVLDTIEGRRRENR